MALLPPNPAVPPHHRRLATRRRRPAIRRRQPPEELARDPCRTLPVAFFILFPCPPWPPPLLCHHPKLPAGQPAIAVPTSPDIAGARRSLLEADGSPRAMTTVPHLFSRLAPWPPPAATAPGRRRASSLPPSTGRRPEESPEKPAKLPETVPRAPPTSPTTRPSSLHPTACYAVHLTGVGRPPEYLPLKPVSRLPAAIPCRPRSSHLNAAVGQADSHRPATAVLNSPELTASPRRRPCGSPCSCPVPDSSPPPLLSSEPSMVAIHLRPMLPTVPPETKLCRASCRPALLPSPVRAGSGSSLHPCLFFMAEPPSLL